MRFTWLNNKIWLVLAFLAAAALAWKYQELDWPKRIAGMAAIAVAAAQYVLKSRLPRGGGRE